MRLVSIDIKNFRVLKSAHIDFPDNVIGIIGPNGAGKSSIVEAVSWALYGNPASRSGKDEIRSTFAPEGEDCVVDLAFMIRDEQYRVVRRLIGKRSRAEVELYRGDKSESVGSIETQNHIASILGLDWRGFLTSFLARQQELNALSDLQPAKRREHLAGMLGIERLDKAIQHVKEDTRRHADQAEFIRKQLAQKETVALRLGELGEHVGVAQARLDRQSGARDEAEKAFKVISERFNQAQADRDACSQIAAKVESETRTAELLASQLKGYTREHDTLTASKAELKELETAIKDYAGIKAEVDSINEARSRAEYRAQLLSQEKTALSELDRLTKRASELQPSLEKTTAELATIPENIKEIFRKAEAGLEKARNSYSRIKAERDVLIKEVDKVNAQISGIDRIGPDAVCDRCHRPYGSDVPIIKAHLQEELSELRQKESELESSLQKLKDEGVSLKEDFDRLGAQKSSRHELAVQKQSLDKDKAELDRRTGVLTEQIERTQTELKGVPEVKFDQARFEQLTAKLTELETKRARHQQLSGSLERLPAVEKGIAETTEKIAAVNAEREKLGKELAAIGFDEKAFEKLSAEFSESQEMLEKEKTASLELAKELEVIKKEIQVKTDQLAGFEKAEEELESCVNGQYYGEKLGSLFADFRKDIIARIRPRLAELSSGLLSEMTDDKFSMVELDKDYNLQIMDYGQLFGIERYSGGEKDLANLCLRLSISLALTESAGLDRSFVILDEVFGSQDDERKALIFHGLSNLKNRFPQILLITHIEEIKHRVETLIQVDPAPGGWSEVKVDGKAT